MADYSTFHEATGWETQTVSRRGVELVCEPRSSALLRRCSLGTALNAATLLRKCADPAGLGCRPRRRHTNDRRDRTHDIVCGGATGVAGRFWPVPDRTVVRAGPLAGCRRAEPGRLNNSLSDLTGRSDAWDDVPVVVGDATDPESLRAIARDTRVVCTSVRSRRTEQRRWSTPPSRPARTLLRPHRRDKLGARDHRPVFTRQRSTPKLGPSTFRGFDSYLRDLGTPLAQSFQNRLTTHRRFGFTARRWSGGQRGTGGALGEV